MSPRTALAGALALFVAAANPAAAQEPLAWSTQVVDANIAAVHSRGSSLAVQLPDRVLMYSPHVHEWTVLPVSAAAVVTAQNEHVLVEDGLDLHGWSAWSGEVDTVTLTAAGAIVPGPGSANFMVAALDGSTVYAYSAKAGAWSTLTLTTPPVVQVNRRCVLVLDGFDAYGFGETGAFSSVPTLNPVVYGTESSLAWLDDGAQLFCYSSTKGLWTTVPTGAVDQLHTSSSHLVAVAGANAFGYSAYRADFAQTDAPAPGYADHVASESTILQDGDDLLAYSAFTNSFDSMVATAADLDEGSSMWLVNSPTDALCTAYSAVKGVFSSSKAGLFTYDTNDVCALIDDGTNAYVYSALTGNWSDVPIAFIESNVIDTSVVVADATSAWAFAARYGSWKELAFDGPAALHPPTSNRGSVYAVTDDAGLHGWNPRLARWSTLDVDASALVSLSVRFSGSMAEGTDSVHAFGAFGVDWNSLDLPEPALDVNSGSGVGWVQTQNFILAHSPYSGLGVAQRFPESTSPALRGELLDLQINAPEGSLVSLYVGRGPKYAPAVGGLSLLDPVRTLVLPTVPAGGRLEHSIPMPADVTSAGRSFQLQAWIVPPNGLPYLTGSVSPTVL